MLHGYITAVDAAKRAGLQYHTFMARVRKGWVKYRKEGPAVFINTRDLDRAINASRQDMGSAAGEILLHLNEEGVE